LRRSRNWPARWWVDDDHHRHIAFHAGPAGAGAVVDSDGSDSDGIDFGGGDSGGGDSGGGDFGGGDFGGGDFGF
jgi:hypothetical protein